MNNVRTLREAAARSRASLAQIVGVTQQAVAKWESGESDPKWELAPLIAAALGCEIGDLFARDPPGIENAS